MNVYDNYLILNFKNIYFSLENLELQKELALLYLENHIFKQTDIRHALMERPRYIDENNISRKTLCDNYLNRK